MARNKIKDAPSTKARYTVTISLNHADNERKEKLQKKNLKVIEIFRAGLDKCEGI